MVTVGLGSNVLAPDAGLDALVVKLAGELAEAGVADAVLSAGGGTATPFASTGRARPASGGFEFACAIPGTAGGGVWMNAGAYGRDWAAILVRALVATAEGRLADTGRARPLLPAFRTASRAGRRPRRVPAGAASRG